jgi:hypothetical protein
VSRIVVKNISKYKSRRFEDIFAPFAIRKSSMTLIGEEFHRCDTMWDHEASREERNIVSPSAPTQCRETVERIDNKEGKKKREREAESEVFTRRSHTPCGFALARFSSYLGCELDSGNLGRQF